MKTVNIHEAKTNLSKLLARVLAGEEIIIAKAGTPVARLSPVIDTARKRVLGRDRDQVIISDDFNAPLPDDILSAFEGEN